MRCEARSIPSVLCRQHGVAAVEFAIVIFVMLLIVAGVIGFGRIFWYLDALTKATRDGARFLSTWDTVSTIGTTGAGNAANLTVISANAARVSPPLLASNVKVDCLDAGFNKITCSDSPPPSNVRVSIVNFNVTVGEWFPFVGESGLINYGGVSLRPSTTMRYMN